jgi:hypothetical protein
MGLASAAAACADDPGAAFDPLAVDWPAPDAPRAFYLSEVGLYADLASERLAAGVEPFSPAFPLWSDAAVKRRWVRLPPDARIDTSDMDRWQLPIGTMFFKEFTRDGVRVETRVIVRLGPRREDYWMGAFIWLPDGSDARFTPDGLDDARGTQHDVPPVKRCWTCHNGEPGHGLGFSALQLSHAGPGVTLAELDARGLLSVPPDVAAFRPPGPSPAADAIGYLHANCGTCHNEHGAARPDTDMLLRLRTDDARPDSRPEDSDAYRSTLGVALQEFSDPAVTIRVVPGDPLASGLAHRMAQRGTKAQMPPFASERVDESGLALIDAWIRSLAP